MTTERTGPVSSGLVSAGLEHRLSGEGFANASVDHAAASRSSDGSGNLSDLERLIEHLRQIADFGNVCPSERHYLTQAADALQGLKEAAAPLARFIEQFDRMPMKQIDDEFYGIHTGTEFEASIRLSDFRKLARALSLTGEERGR